MSLDHSDCELPEAQQESPEQQPQQLDELVAASPEPAAAEPEQAPEPGPEMQEETDPLEQQAAVSAEPQQAASLAIESAAAAAGRAVVVMPPAQPLQHQRQQTQETVCSVNQSQHQTHPSRPSEGSLTFSGPPYVPKAKPYPRADFSHSSVKLMKIAHDNQLLVQRLMSISRKEPAWSKDLDHHTAPCNIASSAINRCKQATTIAQENHALYQRLVAIRPSKDISRDVLEAEHRRNEVYRTNCATFKQHKQAGDTAAVE